MVNIAAFLGAMGATRFWGIVMKKLLLAAAGALALSVAAATPASANITIIEGSSLCQGNVCETVHLVADDGLDHFVSGLIGNFIQVLFTGDENIVNSSPGQGQAWVGGTDGNTDFLKFELLNGFMFDQLEFDLNTASGGQPQVWGATITGVDQFNTAFTTDFTGITNNQFFDMNVVAGSGEHITSMSFHVDGATTTTSPILAAGQFRVGGISGGVVPEPATWALMLTGFGGLGAMLRRRRSLLAAA